MHLEMKAGDGRFLHNITVNVKVKEKLFLYNCRSHMKE